MGTIKSAFNILDPKKIEMRMTTVMTIEDWIVVRDTLSTNPDDHPYWHPANVFKRSVNELIDKANESFHFYDSQEKPSGE